MKNKFLLDEKEIKEALVMYIGSQQGKLFFPYKVKSMKVIVADVLEILKGPIKIEVELEFVPKGSVEE